MKRSRKSCTSELAALCTIFFLAFGSGLGGLGSTSPILTPQTRSSPVNDRPQLPSRNRIRFVSVAEQAGVTVPNVWGGVTTKKYVLETKGNGVAFFDSDGDGWLDVYLSNGTRTEGFPTGQEPTNHLYHNNRDGTFSDVTARSGLARTGWQTGVCVGDYDNDGFEDILLTYWGQNHLYHNNHDGTFTDVTERAGLKQSRVRSERAARFSTTTVTAGWICLSLTILNLTHRRSSRRVEQATAIGRVCLSSAGLVVFPAAGMCFITTTARSRKSRRKLVWHSTTTALSRAEWV